MNALKIFTEKKESITAKTIELIPNSLRGDKVNRSFYIDEDGNVNYSVYAGSIYLDDRYFFSILDHETPEAGDYGYDSDEDFLDDDQFFEDHYRDIISDAIDSHINKLECYA